MTKFISPPFISPLASADKVTVVPDIADTVVPAAILVPYTESPTVILVASATVRVRAAADKSRVPVV